MAAMKKAKGIQSDGASIGMALESLSPSLAQEAQASLERCLRIQKAETIGAPIDRKKSTVYHWAGHPKEIPIGALATLAQFDPDPDFLGRIAWHLMAAASSLAQRRGKCARIVVVEVSPGRWGRT